MFEWNIISCSEEMATDKKIFRGDAYLEGHSQSFFRHYVSIWRKRSYFHVFAHQWRNISLRSNLSKFIIMLYSSLNWISYLSCG